MSLQEFEFVFKKNGHMCEKNMDVNFMQLSYFADQARLAVNSPIISNVTQT